MRIDFYTLCILIYGLSEIGGFKEVISLLLSFILLVKLLNSLLAKLVIRIHSHSISPYLFGIFSFSAACKCEPFSMQEIVINTQILLIILNELNSFFSVTLHGQNLNLLNLGIHLIWVDSQDLIDVVDGLGI